MACYAKYSKEYVLVLGAVFLECWKRYSAEITHRWDLTGFDIQEEHPREEYLVRLKHVRRKERNVVTSTNEPYVPFWRMKLRKYHMRLPEMLNLCLCVLCVAAYRVFSVSMVLLLVSQRKNRIQ